MHSAKVGAIQALVSDICFDVILAMSFMMLVTFLECFRIHQHATLLETIYSIKTTDLLHLLGTRDDYLFLFLEWT